MDDVSLKQKQADDKDLDNLIFSGEKEEAAAKENQPQAQEGDSDSDDKKSTASAKAGGDRSSLSNVLPVDKLKNGANTASKYEAILIIGCKWVELTTCFSWQGAGPYVLHVQGEVRGGAGGGQVLERRQDHRRRPEHGGQRQPRAVRQAQGDGGLQEVVHPG
ncbi:unnamed protein product [Phytophthora fragariaefolia]|uniref:Unnamed protein product n=1 Tax=Phytophthora fragariaefolia TaxID=1490495 RepID=A0A9W7CWW6_9STRA|nr:unnamed protein product [Phytophthora fragariaefolia]